MGGPRKTAGGFKYHQYQIVGRHTPTEAEPSPKLYRMKMWSTDAVRARSKFWYFMSMLTKVKKANGQIIACNEIFEEDASTVQNYGIWVRFTSRSGEHNMYKEYRDTTLNGAVEQMYDEMGSRHRVRFASLQIIKTATIPDDRVKRVNTLQFMDASLKFPLVQQKMRPSSKTVRMVYKGKRPNLCM
uniref:60S ribosomal protein L18a n=2 Tax=Viridiplantae TaxID=33090 RepID=A0A7R9U0R1_9VIRI|eukprot:PRCOL_00006113-RA